MNITLYTYQRLEHDITRPFAPTPEYAPLGAYHEIAQFLGWSVWVWCMAALADYDNPWFDSDQSDRVLWKLSVPAATIKWLALDAQCRNETPVSTWFYEGEQAIRKAGDIPQALLQAPVLPTWVTGRQRKKRTSVL